MPSVNLCPAVNYRSLTLAGAPNAGGKLYTYVSGTTTNQASYTTYLGNVQNANPVVFDANGMAAVWLDDSLTYTLLETDSANVTIRTVDGVSFAGNANAIRYLAYAADTGTANAYIVAPSPAITAYSAGQVVTLKPGNTNTTASTIAVSGLSAKDIKDGNGNAIAPGQLQSNGIYQLTYNGTYFTLSETNRLFANAALSSSVNWNTGVLSPGNYLTSGTTYTGTLPLGASTEHTGALEVRGNGNDLYQTWYNGLVPQRWERMTTDGGTNWSAWREAANTLAYSTTSAIDTLTNADCGILQQLTGSTNRTWTLPSAATCGTNWFIIVKNSGSSSAVLTIARAGSDTIDGQTSLTLAVGQERIIYCTGATTFASVLTSGKCKQNTQATYATNADLSTALPIDDTTPEVTEGAEFISVSFTPAGHALTNTGILILLTGNLSAAAALQGIAIFQDSSCIQAMSISATAATGIQGFATSLTTTVQGNTAIVFSARIGNAAGNAVRLNGTGSAGHFGGTQRAVMTIIAFENGD